LEKPERIALKTLTDKDKRKYYSKLCLPRQPRFMLPKEVGSPEGVNGTFSMSSSRAFFSASAWRNSELVAEAALLSLAKAGRRHAHCSMNQ